MAPSVKVVQRVEQIPGKTVEGPGAYTDLVGSKADAEKPIVAGIWYLQDVSEESPEWEVGWDEVKYVLEGEAIFKDTATGDLLEAKAGDFIWFPAGAKTSLISSKGLKTLYVEQRLGELEAQNDAPDTKLEEIGRQLVARYVEHNPRSAEEARVAASVLPGGNTRTVLHQSPFPLVLVSGDGAFVTSKDNRSYVDFVSEYSAGIFGHSHPAIYDAINEAQSIGMNLGSTIGKEAEFGALIQNRFPSMELMRFTNSGTEANMMAFLTVRDGKNTPADLTTKILVFKHGYHGSCLSFGGDANVATNIPHQYLVGTFNDIEATRPLLHHGIAAILVEPLQSSGGVLPATPEFLQFLRQAADMLQAVLIFDEVVTSRFHFHGLQGHYQITPDMTTLGKYMGGGFSFGCFGGKREIMQQFDPSRPNSLAHSGTYNNNVFTMCAGIAGLKLVTADEIARLNALGDKLRAGINKVMTDVGHKDIRALGFGSAVGIDFSGPSGSILRDIFYFELMERGLLIGRRGFAMLNLMHTQSHIETLLAAFEEVAGLLP
ncbi:hypothetical protein G7054_g5704 [Neopestalotiopsis clavispora]|nr:hypothetical protein G7054_g5704 [Neopestalotiopsis clavispora]